MRNTIRLKKATQPIVARPVLQPTTPVKKVGLPMRPAGQISLKQKSMAGNYGYGDFGSAMGLNIMDIISGRTDISTAISSLAYDEAMKQVSKYGNIVTSFANKAKTEANAVISLATKIQMVATPEEAEAIMTEAKKRAANAGNEANNAIKNYSLTAGALNTLLKIPGLPSSVKDAANGILASAKKSVDSAKNASATAQQALSQIEASYSGKAGSFLPSFSFESPFMKDYGTYLMIGGGVLALGLVGFLVYKRMK